ncbi:PsbP-related protein [Methanobrevibacter sp.]|uniref:PsbP-related protein n=1 Tax=Methanobrevibacter sp. TaxID=66852 RepID=UPI0038652738
MENKILKGSIVIFTLLLLIISVSAVSADSNATSILTLSNSGITISYPSDWGYSKAVSEDSIMAISKLSAIDAFGIGQVNINIEKRPIEGDFYTFVNSTYKSMEKDPNYELVSSGGLVLADYDAMEYVYTSNTDGVEKQHMAVWFEKGGQAYVLLYSAPIDQFEDNLYVFEYVLSDIQIT